MTNILLRKLGSNLGELNLIEPCNHVRMEGDDASSIRFDMSANSG
jgi:hypothetical protein